MARRPSKKPPTKGRVLQALGKQLASGSTKVARHHKAGQRGRLLRHMKRQNGRCAYCGIPLLLKPSGAKSDRRATLDHVVPRAQHGATKEANTVAACNACNAAKADMTAEAFRSSAFCIARTAYAATLPEPVAGTLIVTLRRPRRKRAP